VREAAVSPSERYVWGQRALLAGMLLGGDEGLCCTVTISDSERIELGGRAEAVIAERRREAEAQVAQELEA